MSNYTDKELDDVWAKGRKISDKDPNEYRLDAAGALMKRSHRGKDDEFDWEVDHVFPKHRLEEEGIPEKDWNKMANLRPFNAKNNGSKSDDYPQYTRSLIYDEAKDKNVSSDTRMVVNEDVQRGINRCYGFDFPIVEGDHSDN